MATRVAMPKFGLIMTEGQVVKWIKEDGERVAKGERIAVIMSKKITYQLEAPDDGILRYVARLKESVPCGQTIAFVLAEGEAMPRDGETPGEAAAVAMAAAPVTAKSAGTSGPGAPAAGPEPAPGGFVVASPAARRVAKELGIDIGQVAGSGPGGRVTEDDVRRCVEEQAQQPAVAAPLATSAARQLAESQGLDLGQVSGSGIGGRVTEADVEAVLAQREAVKETAATRSAAPGTLPARPARTVPFAGMRLAIAQNMVESLRTMAQVTSLTEVDVTELVKLREQIKTKFSLTYTDLIVKALAIALKQHPLLNATLAGDEIILLDEIHVGVAVALDEGLIVPAVRNADKLQLAEIAAETKRLAEAARSGTLGVDEAVGSTFTVTNLGTYGIDHSTPVINPPEVAILGVGRIIEKPAVFEGQIAKRSMLGLSLTFDHRVVDGAPAAAFLKTLCELLEKPYLLFV